MKILLDTMGGDNAPDANIKGAVSAIDEIESEVVLVGNEDIINKKIKEFYGKDIKEISEKLSIYNATEIIEMEDVPTQAIKTKKDSSMVVGFNLLKNGYGDVFISAGNSGALLTGATLLVGRIKGVDRPALAGILPEFLAFVSFQENIYNITYFLLLLILLFPKSPKLIMDYCLVYGR